MYATKNVVGVLLFIFTCFTACKREQAQEDVQPPSKKPYEMADEFFMALGGEPKTIDPALATTAADSQVIFNIFEGLMSQGKATGQLEYGMAEKVDISDGGKLYTFKLRENARWSNGDPVTAYDFAYSWERLLAPATGASYANFLWSVENCRAYSDGKLADPAKLGFRALDAKTFEVKLSHPVNYFLDLTSFWALFPVHRGSIEKSGPEAFSAGKIVSNGAFTFATIDKGREITLKKNHKYWAANSVSLNTVHVMLMGDSRKVFDEYENGDLDWTGIMDVPAKLVSEVEQRTDFRSELYYSTYFLRLNVKRKPLNDTRVRQALSLAIDRDWIAKVLLKGGRKAAVSFVPPLPSYPPLTEENFNVEKAKRLLAEAGFPDGKGFPRMTLLYFTDENNRVVAGQLIENWKAKLGVAITSKETDWNDYLQLLDSGEYDVARSAWVGDYSDPMSFLEIWTSSAKENSTGWKSAKYDELIGKAPSVPDPEKRNAMLNEAEKLLIEGAAVVPVFYMSHQYMLNDKVKGFEPHMLDVHMLKYVSKK